MREETSAMTAFGNRGRRRLADLLRADEAIAEPPCKSRIAGASLLGSAPTNPRQIAQAIPATQSEAIAEEAATEVAVTAVAEAINAMRPADKRATSDLPQ